MRKISFSVLVTVFLIMPFMARAADDLCPQDLAEAKNAPSDVAGVQADIDRLNLCVERAKLLKQLDDIAKQRSDTLNKIKDPVGSAMMGNGVSGIAPLPVSALPELPAVKTPQDLKPGEVRVNMPNSSPFGGDEGKSAGKKDSEAKRADWKIRKIWGQAGGVSGATMQAQLSDGSGNLLNVAKGDPLPDGGIVDSVSVKGVTVAQKDAKGINKINNLSWDESGDAGTSPNPSMPMDNNNKSGF